MSHRRINFGGRRPPLQPAETERHSSCFRGEGQLWVAHPSRVLATVSQRANFLPRLPSSKMRKDCFGGVPKPACETHALSNLQNSRLDVGRFPPYLGQHVDLTLVELSGGFRHLIASRRLTARTKRSRGN